MNKGKPILARRKTAYARVKIVNGKGNIIINKKSLEAYDNLLFKYEVKEPLEIAGDVAKKYDYIVEVSGSGNFARARAIRSALAKALVSVEPSLKDVFLKVDRTLLVDDRRITEPQKPYRSAARALKQTSYR